MSASTSRPPLQNQPQWLSTIALLAVLGLAGFLRFDGLAEPSLWLDEILHVKKAQEAAGEPWHAWLTGVSVDRENGSLYYASQLLALELFDGEFAVRLMPALSGLTTVGVLFLVGLWATGSRKVAVVAGVLLAISPLHVYYSREGRPYAAVMLVATLLMLLALKGHKNQNQDGNQKRNQRRLWIRVGVYGLCMATAFWGAVATPVLISCVGLAILEGLGSKLLSSRTPQREASGRLDHKGWRHFALAATTGLALSWMLFPQVQELRGSIAASPADGEYVAQWNITQPLSPEAFDRLLASLSVSGTDRGSTNGLTFLFLALAAWGGIRLARLAPRKALWTIGLCLLPIAGSLAALVLWKHWYNVRYTSAGLPAFLLLVAVGLVDLWDRSWKLGARLRGRPYPSKHLPWVANLLLLGILVFLLTPIWQTARAESLEKPDWRGVAELIDTLGSPPEAVITRGNWGLTCLGYYLEQMGSDIEIASANYDLDQATQLLARWPQAWVLSAGFRKTPDLQAWIQSFDPVLRSRLANLQLYYAPSFEALLEQPGRPDKLASVVRKRRESTTRQEFTGSELLLGKGWSYPEKTPDGRTFRWAMAARAEIAVVPPPKWKSRRLVLRLMPFPSPDQPAQSVAIEVNSRPFAQVSLDPGWNEISLPAMTDGREIYLVAFDFAWRQSPSAPDQGVGDSRQLAAAFDFVDLTPTPEDPPRNPGSSAPGH
ncbi:MAG: glycosyltransferase family 39 protein [Deltaproteobacteria bacterium]|nr:glycosyltransferase family 39 protein [Deltaproteobacteria bacterium]